jgi:hypothetical protein
MKKFSQLIQSHPARFYLVLFLFLIAPAVGLYPLAKAGNQVGMGVFLALIILANIAALFS